MNTINLWESGFSKYYTFINDIDELVNIIKNSNTFIDFKVTDRFLLGDSITNVLEEKASENNKNINLTDDDHNIAINSDGFLTSYISPSFYEKNKDKILDAINYNILNNNETVVSINNEMFNEEIFRTILNKKDVTSVYFNGITLTDKQIDEVRKKYIDAYVINGSNRTQISYTYLIGQYKFNDLTTLNSFYIPVNIHDKQIDYFNLIKNGAVLFLTNDSLNEEKYFKKCSDLINKLNGLDKHFIININVNNRAKFKEYLNSFGSKCTLVINSDFYEYSRNEYETEEKKLDDLVADIKKSDLSPFEKYIAVYNIVKKFKKYRENPDDPNESRRLRYILNNEYIVCVGYSNLFKTLLDRVDIKNMEYSTSIYNVDDKTNDVNYLGGHERNIVSIDDEKYNIHGYYLADATWDNVMDNDSLIFSLMTFDDTTKNNEMFSLKSIDHFLDVHDFSEFVLKFNRLYNFECSKSNDYDFIYSNLCLELIKIFKNLDEDKYNEFMAMMPKHHSYERYTEIITKIGRYLAKRSNNHVSLEKIVEADVNVLKQFSSMSSLEIDEYRDKVFDYNKKRSEKAFIDIKRNK